MTRTLFDVSFAICHKVKLIEATKQFWPLLEDGATRKWKFPTSHSCPADLAVSGPQVPLRRETETRADTKPPAARTKRATRLPRKSPSSNWNWKTLWRMASNCGKASGCGSNEPMHQTQREACRVQSALRSLHLKAQFRRDWASQELRNLKQKKPTAKAAKTWTGSWAFTCVTLQWWRNSATPTTPKVRFNSRRAVHGCHGMP